MILATILAATLTPTPPPAIWHHRAAAEVAARRTACPSAPVGCFASPPGCAVSVCSCGAVCAPRRSVGRVWRRAVVECRCE